MDNLSAIYFRFMASKPGRILRGGIGAVLIIAGFAAEPPYGIYCAVVGLFPLVASALDLCVFAPLWGYPIMGGDLRRKLAGPSVQIRGPLAD